MTPLRLSLRFAHTVALVLTLLLGQSPLVASAINPASSLLLVEGLVLGPAGDPVPGARLRLTAYSFLTDSWDPVAETIANGEGRFILPLAGLPDDYYALNALPPAGSTGLAPSFYADVVLSDGQLVMPEAPVTMELNERLTALTGTVSRPDGSPEPGAKLIVERFNNLTNAWELVSSATRSDAAGAFSFPVAGLSNDIYWMSAAPATASAALAPSGYTNFEVYDGYLVGVWYGPPATADLRLTDLQASGQVRTPDGAPVINADVRVLTATDSFAYDNRYTDETGRYSFGGLPDDTYYLQAVPPPAFAGRAWPSPMVPVAIDSASPSTEPVTLTLAGPSLTGKVETPDGRAVENALITVLDPTGEAVTYAHTAGDGIFALAPDALEPGVYVVTTDLGMTSGFRVPSGQQVTITPGATARASFKLRDAVKIVTGQVTRQGAPVEGALVYAYGVDSSGYVETYSDASGGYRLPLNEGGAWFVGVSPGYSIDWWYDGEEVAARFTYSDSAEVRQIDFAGLGLNTRVDGHVELDGIPFSGAASVNLVGADGRAYTQQVGPDGRFSVVLPPGTYTIAVQTADPSLDIAPAAPVVVMANTTTALAEPIRLERLTSRIVGRLVVSGETQRDALGNERPVGASGVPVVATGADGRARRATTTTGGVYELFVRPGLWELTAAPAAGNRLLESTSQSVSVAAGATAETSLSVRRADREVWGSLFSPDPRVDVAKLSGTVYAIGDAGSIVSSAPISEGRYALPLPRGSYSLVVEFPMGFNFLVQPQPADLTETLRARLDLPVALASGLIVGRVMTTAGDAARGLDAIVTGMGEGGRREARVGANGFYSLALPPGEWSLSMRLGPRSAADFHLPRDLNPNLGVQVLDGETEVLADDERFVVAPRSHQVTGVVLGADGQPRAGAALRAADASGFTVQEVRSDSAGTYSLALPAGAYTLNVAGGPADLATTVRLSLSGPSGETAREIRLRAANATLRGVVTGPGAAGALVSATSSGGAVAQVQAGADGGFSFSASAGENWRVWAVGVAGGAAYQSPYVTAQVSAGGLADLAVALSPVPVPLPAPVTRTVAANELNIIQLSDGARVVIPPFALAAEGLVTVSFGPTVELAPRADWVSQVYGYRLTAADAGGAPITRFRVDLAVQLPIAEGPATAPASASVTASSTRNRSRAESTRGGPIQSSGPRSKTRDSIDAALDPARALKAGSPDALPVLGLARAAAGRRAGMFGPATVAEEPGSMLVVSSEPGLFGVQINVGGLGGDGRTVYLPMLRR